MENIDSLIDAINNLTNAIENNNTYWTSIFSTVIATFGSIIAVLTVDAIKFRFINPIIEFRALQKRILGTHNMYAPYYSHPINGTVIANLVTSREEENYVKASIALRKLSVEHSSFAYTKPRKSYNGVTKDDLIEASFDIVNLSNQL